MISFNSTLITIDIRFLILDLWTFYQMKEHGINIKINNKIHINQSKSSHWIHPVIQVHAHSIVMLYSIAKNNLH